MLKDIVDDSRRNQGQGPVKKAVGKVKWVLDEKKIAQSCKKLETVKHSLNTVLSLVGRKVNGPFLPYKAVHSNDRLQAKRYCYTWSAQVYSGHYTSYPNCVR